MPNSYENPVVVSDQDSPRVSSFQEFCVFRLSSSVFRSPRSGRYRVQSSIFPITSPAPLVTGRALPAIPHIQYCSVDKFPGQQAWPWQSQALPRLSSIATREVPSFRSTGEGGEKQEKRTSSPQLPVLFPDRQSATQGLLRRGLPSLDIFSGPFVVIR